MATAKKFTRFLTYAFLLSLTAMLSFFIGGKKSEQNGSLLSNLTPPTAHADNPGLTGCASDTGAGGCTGTGGTDTDGSGGADGSGGGCAGGGSTADGAGGGCV